MLDTFKRIDNFFHDEKTAERVKQLLQACKNEREENFINFRFGVEDGVPKTLQEVADHFSITRDRAMQIEKMIYRRISGHHNRRKRLLDYLNA